MSDQAIAQEDRPAGVTPLAPWRIKSVTVLPGHRLAVTFQDGVSGVVDFSAVKESKQAGIYAELADEKVFASVSLELGALAWPNGADFDPAWMHEMLSDNKTWSIPF